MFWSKILFPISYLGTLSTFQGCDGQKLITCSEEQYLLAIHRNPVRNVWVFTHTVEHKRAKTIISYNEIVDDNLSSIAGFLPRI